MNQLPFRLPATRVALRPFAITSMLLAVLAFPEWPATAQNDSKVEKLDPLTAEKLNQALGFNVKVGNDWEFPKAKAAGATEVRMQFDWNLVENMDGQLQLRPAMQKSLDLCVQNGLQPLVIAAYGPPRTAVGDLTVTADTPAGATTIPVSGALGAIKTPYCHVTKADGTQIVAEGKWAYYGALIDGVDGNSITLAAKTKAALPAGTMLRVNRLLYPSVATADPNDPSMVAFGRYVNFLAGEISRRGLTGKVELWNEPPWAHDRWDARGGFYDSPPPGITAQSPNWGMLQRIMAQTPPRGVTYIWGGAHKSGSRGALKLPRQLALRSPGQENVEDSFHPYGETPEWHAWDPDCLSTSKLSSGCGLEGSSPRSNMAVLRKSRLLAKGRTAGYSVTEVGIPSADQSVKARYDLRAFLVYLSLGAERIDFYRLADAPGSFAFVDINTQAALQPYTAIKALMEKIQTMALPPADSNENDLPSVEAYQGSFPLLTIPIVGRSSAREARNRILFVSYQRTYPSPGGKWVKMPSPPPAPVRVRMPSGYSAVRAWNLVSGDNVSLSGSGANVSYSVSDDPVAVEMVPAGR